MILFGFLRVERVRSLKYKARKVYKETGNIIKVIKAIKAETGWGIRESKQYFDEYIRKDR